MEHGADHVWISHEHLPDLLVMATVPDLPGPEEDESPPARGVSGRRRDR